MDPKRITVFTDGAARGNPGESASGFQVREGGRQVHKAAVYNGLKTNNHAEYNAMILALEWCAKHVEDPKGTEVDIFSDSELVVHQLSGSYRLKSKALMPLNAKVRSLVPLFRKVTFRNVPREDEGIVEVDAELNALLDRMGK